MRYAAYQGLVPTPPELSVGEGASRRSRAPFCAPISNPCFSPLCSNSLRRDARATRKRGRSLVRPKDICRQMYVHMYVPLSPFLVSAGHRERFSHARPPFISSTAIVGQKSPALSFLDTASFCKLALATVGGRSLMFQPCRHRTTRNHLDHVV